LQVSVLAIYTWHKQKADLAKWFLGIIISTIYLVTSKYVVGGIYTTKQCQTDNNGPNQPHHADLMMIKAAI
jgi:hypothetical protein